MTHIDCPRFENCSAPLCPLAKNLQNLIWYPDEDICARQDFQSLRWIKKQKAVVKKKARTSAAVDCYFTVEMLTSIKQLRRGIEGINPDQPLADAKKAEQQWVEGRVLSH